MSWQRRAKSSNAYFYRFERRGGKVCKIYGGSSAGPTAKLVARAQKLAEAQRHADRATEAGVDDPGFQEAMYSLCRDLDRLHRTYALSRQATPSEETAVTIRTELLSQGEFLAMIASANHGSQKAMGELRELFDNRPEIWQAVGDLGRLVEGRLLEMAAEGSPCLREALCRQLDEMRRRLGAEPADALAKLFVDRIVATWLDVQVCQVSVHHSLTSTTEARKQKRLDQAQRRHLQAIEALARHRRGEVISHR